MHRSVCRVQARLHQRACLPGVSDAVFQKITENFKKGSFTMSITFKSQATGDLFMVQAHAESLLKLLGKAPAAKGIIEPKDMPAALEALRALGDEVAEDEGASAPERARDDDADAREDGEPREPGFLGERVSLRLRAWPLIQMLEKAHAADKPIVWGV